MKRKKQLYEELKAAEHELKSLVSFVKGDETIHSEDEIHSWAIEMNALISNLETLKEEVLEFYRS